MTLLRTIIGILGIAFIIIGFIAVVIGNTTWRRVGALFQTLVLIGLTYYVWFG